MIDYGVNNVGSVVNMLRRLDVPVQIGREGRDLESAAAIVLPGIGAFDKGVANLRETGLFDEIRERVAAAATPILGICLGMQLLSRGSDEGESAGLGLIPAFTRRFAFSNGASHFKVPHMGWNETMPVDREFFAELPSPGTRFYYVHSYHVVCDEPGDVAATCNHGLVFTAALRRGRVFGTQFHPEKSHRFGMQLLANFVRLSGCA